MEKFVHIVESSNKRLDLKTQRVRIFTSEYQVDKFWTFHIPQDDFFFIKILRFWFSSIQSQIHLSHFETSMSIILCTQTCFLTVYIPVLTCG